MRIKKHTLFLWVTLCVCCLISTVLTIVYASTSEQVLMCFLPLTYIIAVTWSGSFKNILNFATPGLMIVNFIYFLKCVVYPPTSVLSAATSVFRTNKIIIYAILLEIGEIIVIYLIFHLYEKFHMCTVIRNREYALTQNHLDDGRFVIFCFLLFVVALILLFPSVLNSYNFFTVESLEVIRDGMSESTESGIVTLVIKLARYILVAFGLGWSFCRYRKTEQLRYVWSAVILVALSVVIVRGVSRSDFVIPGLCGYLLLIRLFPKQSKVISISLLGCIAVVFITFSAMRYGKSGTIEGIAETLQAYLCCEKNMAIAISARKIYINEIGIDTLFSDLLGNWAGIGAMVRDKYNITDYFNFTYYGHRFAVDQIVPTIGQGYMQFGILGTYVYTIVMSILCMEFDKKYRESDKVEFSYLYLYGAIKCAMTLMGNFKIFSATIFNVLFPMLVLFWLNQKIAMKRR